MNTITILKSAVTALLAIAGKDVTRAHLCSVAVDFANLALAATDGHRAVVWFERPGDADLSESTWHTFPRLMIEQACKLVKASGEITFGCDPGTSALSISAAGQTFNVAPSGTFPPLSQVIPEYRNGNTGHCCPGVNPLYLADTGKLGKALGASLIAGHGAPMRIQTGRTDLDPIRFDLSSSGGQHAIYVLMPMRM